MVSFCCSRKFFSSFRDVFFSFFHAVVCGIYFFEIPRMTLANPKDHGRIIGHDLMDVSRLVMSANMDGETRKGSKPKVETPVQPEEP